MNTLRKTKEILRKYDIVANKRYGQNFLIDDNILNNIVESADINENTLVIEIGPGLGNLTEYLLEKSAYMVLIEIDKKMLQILEDRFTTKKDKFYLLNEDILKVDIDKLISEIEFKNNCKYESIKVVANLPYYITTPIIFQLLQSSTKIQDIIVMVQKEVADRMESKPNTKDYSILTLMVEYYSNANIQFIVPKDSFIPAPNVTSAVIKLCRKNDNLLNKKEEKVLFELIHKAFAKRRKKMLNSLYMENFQNLDKSELQPIFNELVLDENTRAEQLSLEEYVRITKFIVSKK